MNAALGEALDGLRRSWSARAEQTGNVLEGGGRPDVLVEDASGWPVVVEAERADHASAERDAIARLGRVVVGRSFAIETAIALVYPDALTYLDGARRQGRGVDEARLDCYSPMQTRRQPVKNGGGMQLTDAQQRAVRFDGRNLQLIACAGSGKTEVLAQRVAHLLTQKEQERLSPRNVVAFTFTEKAAAELKDRIHQRTNEAAEAPLVGMAEMYVGTIHGFCLELLQTEAPEYLKYATLDRMRQVLYVNRKSAKTGLTRSTKLNGTPLKVYQDTDRYINALAVLREDDIEQSALSDCSVAKGLERYKQQLAEDAYFDFSALLDIAVRELTENPVLRERIAGRIKYVIVDEYQDVNPIQEKLISMLHSMGASLCVVGDDDQTIYQWRGSAVDNILTFQERYANVGQVTIAENHRSSAGVIETARGFIQKIEERLPKTMQFADAQRYEEGDIVALAFDAPEEEGRYIAETIRSLYGVAFNDSGGERGLSWSDMAVLLRSVRYNGAAIVDALQSAGIPVVVNGLANLFETDEAKAARDLFYFIAGWSSVTEQTVRKAWGNPSLGLTKANVRKAVQFAKRIRGELQVGASWPNIQKVYLDFLEIAGMREERVPDKHEAQSQGTQGEVVMFNLGKFSQAISDWEAINFNSDPSQSFQKFAGFLRYQADGAYSEGWEDAEYATPDAVQIMTVHQAKGREWPVVFIPALLRNRFPANPKSSEVWSLLPSEAIADPARYDGSIDDERRLFYVAMTRSKKFLHMTWAPIHGSNRYARKSDFWDEILSSKWVKRRKPNYAPRKRLEPKPRASVSNIEFSFSDLKYLFECGYQFKLRVLYGFNGPLAMPMGYGKSLHDALAEVHQRAMRKDLVSEADTAELVSRHLHIPYAFGEVRSRLEAAAHKAIQNYIRDKADIFPHVEFSEKSIEIELGDGVSIKGRIDLVTRLDTGETAIVDLKSNERSQAEEVTELQLHTYALGYRDLTGRDADSVQIYELEERRPKSRPVDSDFIADVQQKTREAAAALRERRLIPSPSQRKCRACDFKTLCSASQA